MRAGKMPAMPKSGAEQTYDAYKQLKSAGSQAQSLYNTLFGKSENQTKQAKAEPAAPAPAAAPEPAPKKEDVAVLDGEILAPVPVRTGGLVRPAFNFGSSVPYGDEELPTIVPREVLESGANAPRVLPKSDEQQRALAQQLASGQSSVVGSISKGLGAANNAIKGGKQLFDSASKLFGSGKGAEGAAEAAKAATAATDAAAAAPAAVTDAISGAGAMTAAPAAAAAGEAAAAAGATEAASFAMPEILSTIGTAAAEFLPALLAVFASDRRIKHDVKPIGRLYDGQMVYRYHFGDGNYQIGLMAQDAEKNGHKDAVHHAGGLKMLDYKSATEDAAKKKGFYSGGLARPAYQTEGFVEPASYSEEADMPAVGATAMEGNDQELAKRLREEEILDRAAAVTRQKESSNNYGIIGPVIPSGPYKGDRPYGAYQVMGLNVGPWTEKYLGQRMTPEEFLKDKQAQDNLFKAAWGENYRKYGNPADAASIWASGVPLAQAQKQDRRDLVFKTRVSDYVNDFMRQMEGGSPAGGLGAGRGATLGRGATQSEATSGKPTGLMAYLPNKFETGKPFESPSDFFTSKQFVVPAIAAIGKALSTPTRSPAYAIGAGLVEGAQTYSGLEKQTADIEQTREGTKTQAQVTAGRALENLRNSGFTRDGRTYVVTSKGVMLEGAYLSMPPNERPDLLGEAAAREAAARLGGTPLSAGERAPLLGPAEPGAQPAGTAGAAAPGAKPAAPAPLFLGDAGRTQAKADKDLMVIDPKASQPQKVESNAVEAAVNQRANDAKVMGNRLNQLSGYILSLPETGWTTSGPTAAVRNAWSGYINNILDVANVPKEYRISPQDIGSAEAAQKIARSLEFAQSQGADQRSLGALQRAAETVPQLGLSKDGDIKILSGLYQEKQEALDQRRYLTEYKNYLRDTYGPAFANNYFAQNALKTFADERSGTKLGEEKANIERFLRAKRGDQPLFKEFYGANRKPSEYIDRLLGQTGLSRYIENN
jgi:hypothetical protein